MITNDTLKIIRQRRSTRDYRDEQIKEEELQAVLDAGLFAPNAGNQAWHFTVIQNEELLTRLNAAAKQAAIQIGGHLGALGNDENFSCLYGAPTLIIVSCDEKTPAPEIDCAAATQNLLLAAESVGLGSCWIYFILLAFYSPEGESLRKELRIPEGYKPCTATVLGYKNAAIMDALDRKNNVITRIN